MIQIKNLKATSIKLSISEIYQDISQDMSFSISSLKKYLFLFSCTQMLFLNIDAQRIFGAEIV